MLSVNFVKDKMKIPVKYWVGEDTLEPSCKAQILNLANLPFAFRHIAIMPDAHSGYGMPIGGVLAAQRVVIPNAVGVDIGCGMCAVKTSLTDLYREKIKRIFGGSKDYQGGIRSAIPVGFSRHSKKQDENLMPKSAMDIDNNTIISKEYESALKQLGTLGGGNHFIEIQKGSDGHIWIMIHSGSRNLGYKVARHYNDLAKKLNQKWHTSVPKEFDLAFLPLDSEEGQMYLREMNYCLEFALANRKLMMQKIIDIFASIYPTSIIYKEEGTFWVEPYINIHHNYATMENHFGQNVMVHRKGATSAKKEQLGIIPGSQGTKSYIVRGKGNIESFFSCSHGAGRLMGRKEAKRKLILEDEQKRLDEKGILHSIRGIDNLDEAAGAYKDIDTVINNQKDLVDIVVELEPMAVIKG